MDSNKMTPHIRLKREFMDVLDKAYWGSNMMRCYLYIAFEADPQTGETGYLPTGDIIDGTGISKTRTYAAIKTLKEVGAIVQLDGYVPRYHLPHIC